MSLKNTLGKVGVGLAGFAFRIAFYACMAVLIFWAGKQAYTFGYQVFDQEAISPGDGSLVAVTIPTGSTGNREYTAHWVKQYYLDLNGWLDGELQGGLEVKTRHAGQRHGVENILFAHDREIYC